jgi:diguanylate cyclase (GGDEF)-like protein
MKTPISRKMLVALSICILVLTVDVGFSIALPDGETRVAFLDILPVVVNIGVSIALFWAARRSAAVSKRLEAAWLLIAISNLIYTAGDITWAVLEAGLHISPFPSIADIFYLSYYTLFLAGTVILAIENRVVIDRLKNTLDMAIIMAGAMLVFWYFLFHPIIQATANDIWTMRFLALAYPVGDVILLASILWLMNSNPIRYARAPIFLLVISSSITMFADIAFSFQESTGAYVSGGLLDIAWIASYLLVGLAAVHQALYVKNMTSSQHQQVTIFDPLPVTRRILSYLPYFWLATAYSLLAIENTPVPTENSELLYVWVGIIITLVIMRQWISLRENKNLYLDLHNALTHLKDQAETLENTNRELQEEIRVRTHIEQRLTYAAQHDALTDLPNRNSFMERLDQAIEKSRKLPKKLFSVLFMDVDQFKVINDSLGHHLGDELLKILANRLRNCLRDTDMVARLGGDEFVFLIENVSSEDAIDFIVNRVQTAIQKVIVLEKHPIYITTSIGVVWNLRGYETPGNVLRDADLAMYHAKHMGKDRYEVFHEGLRLQAISRMEIEEHLRDAIKNHELELYYQPIQHLMSNRIVGFEALIRWNHPTYGMLYPAEFLAVAEETGLSLPIGQWSLTEACKQVKKWQRECDTINDIYISINVSARQFAHPDLISEISKVLHHTNVDPKNIRLEITETTLIEYTTAVEQKFKQLRELGVDLAIDDFGTGYSSLSYLKNIPAQCLKIDQSFIRELGQHKRASDLVKAMIELATDLNLEVIAEGIESPEQLEALKRLSCTYGQGFLLSLPLNTDSVEQLLREHSYLPTEY